MKALVIYNNDIFYWNWLQALWFCRKEFKKKGISIKFRKFNRLKLMIDELAKLFGVYKKKSVSVSDIKGEIKEQYDIVFMCFHYNDDFFKISSEEQKELFVYIKRYCKKLVWLDPSDSTGTCSFQVMPYVELYLKKQLLKDFSIYQEPLYGQRIYSDYYNKKYGMVSDKDTTLEFTLLRDEYKKKLGVSWNVGLSNIGFRRTKRQWRISVLLGMKDYVSKNNIRKLIDRKNCLFFDGAYDENGALTYQRKLTHELIVNMKRGDCVSPDKRLSREMYLENLQNTVFCISPFGFGEVCLRDFEIFFYGGVLIKPDMSHCVTYPDYYRNGETYVAIDWDFLEFKTMFTDADFKMKEYDKYQTIADNGRECFEHYSLSYKQGRKLFVDHLIRQIK